MTISQWKKLLIVNYILKGPGSMNQYSEYQSSSWVLYAVFTENKREKKGLKCEIIGEFICSKSLMSDSSKVLLLITESTESCNILLLLKNKAMRVDLFQSWFVMGLFSCNGKRH